MYMYILHIETSTAVCSVALSQGPDLLVYRDVEDGMNHAAILAPAIRDLLQSVSLKPADLSAISVSSGPGSYTGLRVGSSTAKAMAYSLGIPIIAVPTLWSLANAAFVKHPEAAFALPMIDARRKEVYAALYDRSGKELWPVSSLILGETFINELIPKEGRIICCGDGSLKIGDLPLLSSGFEVDTTILCSARNLISPSWVLYQGQTFREPLHYVPYYMKPPNITVPRQAGLG